MLREILGNLVALLAALSTASFPFISICAETHMKVRDMLPAEKGVEEVTSWTKVNWHYKYSQYRVWLRDFDLSI